MSESLFETKYNVMIGDIFTLNDDPQGEQWSIKGIGKQSFLVESNKTGEKKSVYKSMLYRFIGHCS